MTDDEIPEVPLLIWALADRLTEYGIPTAQAVRQASDMLTEAMDQPDDYIDQLELT